MSNLESSPKSAPPSPFYGVVRTFVFLTVNSESLETFSGEVCAFVHLLWIIYWVLLTWRSFLLLMCEKKLMTPSRVHLKFNTDCRTGLTHTHVCLPWQHSLPQCFLTNADICEVCVGLVSARERSSGWPLGVLSCLAFVASLCLISSSLSVEDLWVLSLWLSTWGGTFWPSAV